jgi:hypothetical protein
MVHVGRAGEQDSDAGDGIGPRLLGVEDLRCQDRIA